MNGTHLSRRRLLVALLAAGAGACTSRRESASDGATAAGPAVGGPTAPPPSPAPPAPSPSPPPPPPFTPLPSDSLPNAKRLAGRVTQQLTTYGSGEDALATATRALDPLLSEESAPSPLTADLLAPVVAPLVAPGTSTSTIDYAQLGGYTPATAPPRCSVMVVTRQVQVLPDGSRPTTIRTIDVRLEDLGEGWRLEAVADLGGVPVAPPPALPPDAQAVLTDPRIALPDSARWDVHAGLIGPNVLLALSRMAAIAPFAVTVLRSGHPVNVFGGDRLSDHTRGLAVDIWSVGGRPVLGAPLDGPLAGAVARGMVSDQDLVTQVGSPWDLDAVESSRSFTDAVHADHLHVAVR